MASMLIILLLLLTSMAASFVFYGMETSVISANRYKLRQMHGEGDDQAAKTLETLANTSRLISALLVGSNFVGVLTVLFFKLLLNQPGMEWTHGKVLGLIRWDEFITVVVLTPIMIVFVEVLPKALFRARADTVIHTFRPLLNFISFIFSPVVGVLDGLVKLVLIPFGGHKPGALTRADVLMMLNPPVVVEEEPEAEELSEDKSGAPKAATVAAPVLDDKDEMPSFMREPDERLLIRNIIQLERVQVREIMQPLIQLEAVHLGFTSLDAFLKQARESGYSRYPAYRHRIVNLVGYIDVYDVIRDPSPNPNLEAYLRPAHYVPTTKRVDDLLQEFLLKRISNAVAVDESGGCCGWITREDILEEIVGELEDELDSPLPMVQEQGEDAYQIRGGIGVENLNELLGTTFDDRECHTLGGIIMKEMGRIPGQGDEIVLQGWRMKILKMEGMRVALVRTAPHKKKSEN